MVVSEEMRAKILEGKTEEQRLGLTAHWGLVELSSYYERRKDPRFYEVNALLRACEKIWQ